MPQQDDAVAEGARLDQPQLAGVVRGAEELPAAAEELARDVTLLGTYEDAEQVIGAWLAAGADRVNLVLPPDQPEEELAAVVDVAGRLAAATTSGGP